MQIIDALVQKGVSLIAIKEAIRLEGKQTLQTKALLTLFGLFAEIERDLIAERTKEGLMAARAKGKRLGRPKGALGKSKLDGKEQKIQLLAPIVQAGRRPVEQAGGSWPCGDNCPSHPRVGGASGA